MKKSWQDEDEPTLDGDEWLEWGGELIQAQGFTSGGAPYGLTVGEFKECTEMTGYEKGWAVAKRAIRRAVVDTLGNDAMIDLGWIKKIGEGFDRDVFMADVELPLQDSELPSRVVALVPRRDAPDAVDLRAQKEPALLERLAALDLPFAVPKWALTVAESGRQVLVRELLRGAPLDLRVGRQGSVKPWMVVAEIAAMIHSIDIEAVKDLAPFHPSRRAHALACIGEITEIQGELVTDAALAWMLANLPQEEPPRFLHGDLLGQNILFDFFDPDQPVGVVDWEFSSVGDPAYDLAIVTRGARRPFKMADGLDRLLHAYREAGGASITRTEVHLYELYLVAGFYRDALKGEHPHPPEQVLGQLRGLLKRLERS